MNIADLLAKQKSLGTVSAEALKNLDEWYQIELTYTSNAIEGNTLSRAETAIVVEKGTTVEGKSVREHLEAINHARAWKFAQNLLKRKTVTEAEVLDIHRIILTGIDDANAGRYRSVPVRIAGSTVIMPNPLRVPEMMTEFFEWLSKDTVNPITRAIEAHYKFVSIHPFVDGNGRTARILGNILLGQAGYPPAIIRKEDRLKYISSLEKAQLGGSKDDFYALMIEAVDRSLDIYLETVSGQKTKSAKKLVKIGELAKNSFENVPTLRFWTKQGLLPVAEKTSGGYALYDESMVERVKEIRRLQREKRLTIKEIKFKF